ncbi:MAG TPA: hypothetical protein VLF60_02495 [Candidatus Saccharimonadales bacterium]|nr:hypothetical protein [Candidatus Saccharimonadales bacterium]
MLESYIPPENDEPSSAPNRTPDSDRGAAQPTVEDEQAELAATLQATAWSPERILEAAPSDDSETPDTPASVFDRSPTPQPDAGEQPEETPDPTDTGSGSGQKPPEDSGNVAEGGDEDGDGDRDPESNDSGKSSEAQPEDLSPLLVEAHRQVGNADVLITLVEPTPDNYAAVAESLKDCEVVILEAVGRTEEERRKSEANYTDALAVGANAEEYEDLFASAKDQQEWSPAGVLAHLRATGKAVRFADMSEDDPRYPTAVQETHATIEECMQTVRQLAPVPQARVALKEAVHKQAEATRVRDTLMQQQVQEIAADYGAQETETTIGIVAAASRYRALAGLGQEVTSGTKSVAQEVTPHLSSFARAVQATIDGDAEGAAAYTDRALLESYMSTWSVSVSQEKQWEAPRIAKKLVNYLNDASCEQLLSRVGEDLADQTQSVGINALKVQLTFRTAFESLMAG